jgi:hypothetical protein
MCLVKYSTAVARLRSCAVDLDRLAGFTDEPLMLEAWVFGELLEHPDDVEVVSLALVIDLPAQDVTWRARPTPAEAAASVLRFEKYRCAGFGVPACGRSGITPSSVPCASGPRQGPTRRCWTHSLTTMSLRCLW